MIRIIAVCCFLIVLGSGAPGTVVAQTGLPFSGMWRVADLAAADGDYAMLGSDEGKLVHRVSTGQMRRIYAVERAIARAAELDSILVVVDGTMPNAFAAIGKRGQQVVGINFAMLELIGLDMHMAAALIGHEVAHLKLEHGEQADQREQQSSVLGTLGSAMLGGLGVPDGGLISGLTVSAMNTAYSREHEREADYLGAIWAIEAGFRPDGAVRLHETIHARSRGQGSPFFSTHPSGPERIESLKAISLRLSRP